jgi:hypothetical protein
MMASAFNTSCCQIPASMHKLAFYRFIIWRNSKLSIIKSNFLLPIFTLLGGFLVNPVVSLKSNSLTVAVLVLVMVIYFVFSSFYKAL